MRVDAIDPAAVRPRLLANIKQASLRLLQEAAPRLDELPGFARRSARRLCLRPAACADPALAAACVFEDTSGTFHSYAALATQKRWLFTSLEPPYPTIKKLTLRLKLDEAQALTASFELVRVDAQIERALKGEQKRHAPEVPAVLLSNEQRAGCLITAPVSAEGTTGEVGVLLPPRADLAGGTLFVTRRPLCSFECGEGFPLVMALNDDSVEPDRYFEGPADRGVLPVLAQRARAAARGALERAFSPMSDRLSLARRSLESAGTASAVVCGWAAPSRRRPRSGCTSASRQRRSCAASRREASEVPWARRFRSRATCWSAGWATVPRVAGASRQTSPRPWPHSPA